MYGVLAPVVVEEYGLNLYVSKGQSSASYLYEASEAIREDGRLTVVYILADFDPGGFRIAEKIEAGLQEHLGDAVPITAHRVAVTYEQMRDPELDIPTRKVKKSDKDAAEFIAQYGDVSAELEAIPPHTLREMLQRQLKCPVCLRRERCSVTGAGKHLAEVAAVVGACTTLHCPPRLRNLS